MNQDKLQFPFTECVSQKTRNENTMSRFNVTAWPLCCCFSNKETSVSVMLAHLCKNIRTCITPALPQTPSYVTRRPLSFQGTLIGRIPTGSDGSFSEFARTQTWNSSTPAALQCLKKMTSIIQNMLKVQDEGRLRNMRNWQRTGLRGVKNTRKRRWMRQDSWGQGRMSLWTEHNSWTLNLFLKWYMILKWKLAVRPLRLLSFCPENGVLGRYRQRETLVLPFWLSRSICGHCKPQTSL